MLDRNAKRAGIPSYELYNQGSAKILYVNYVRNELNDTLEFELLLTVEMWNLFVENSAYDITADTLPDSFSIEYPEPGSNNRPLEENACGHSLSLSVTVSCIFIFETVANWYIYPLENSQTSVPDILQFLTGSDKLPATGFDRTPTINFIDCKCLPVA